ncbi:MAG: energy coupling factor transporter S component ThiW [Sedimentibacter sp.]
MIKTKKNDLKKQVITALLACMGYVLNTFVWFPRMAPFQHFINVIAAVFLGPGWGFVCALLIGLLRMMLNGSTILAVIGAVVGAFLSGLLYQKFQKLIWAVIGEVIGTGIISAIIAYPFMRAFYGLPATSVFTYVPFFVPSSLMGAMLGYLLLKTLEKTNTLQHLKSLLDN